ncbi:MAG: hypothetical protein OEZ38_06695 [Gammaproteobacteria bacterium]|nr:hypothetical protein [Gammaproteobacteria bacterium]
MGNVYSKNSMLFITCLVFIFLQACTSVATFPTVARAGDTVSLMVGSSEKARKDTVSVILTDAAGADWDLQSLGLVRSVFNLRADGRAVGQHYASYSEKYFSWFMGHEPVQTVLVTDIPVSVAPGNATITVNTLVNDDSSGVALPYVINLEIIPGLGQQDNFERQDFGGNLPVDFSRLEPAPHAKINFGNTGDVVIGAASLVVDFDETVVNPGDINLYVPESTMRGTPADPGSFGETQRMVYWRQDGNQLYIDVIAPQGIKQTYLLVYIVHPTGLSGSANMSITSADIYDVNGDVISLAPTLEYYAN